MLFFHPCHWACIVSYILIGLCLKADLPTFAGGCFLQALPHVLHPEHGTIVINVHGGRISSAYNFLTLIRPNPGFDESSDSGKSVLRLINNYTNTILEGHKNGCCFSLSTIHQDNIVIVITRRLPGFLTANTLAQDMKVMNVMCRDPFPVSQLFPNSGSARIAANVLLYCLSFITVV